MRITLGELGLDLRNRGNGGESHVGVKGDDRLSTGDILTALGGDDDHTVAGAHTVQGGSGLTLQDVDALNVVRVDIQGAVGIVGTSHGTARGDVGRRGDRHTVDHIQRRVVAGEGTGTTDGDLRGSTRHTGGRSDVHTGNLTGHGGSQVSRSALEEVFAGDSLRGITQGFLFTGDTHRGDHDFAQILGVGFHGDFHVSGDRDFDGLHTHKGDDQLSRRGNIREGETTVQVGQNADGGILHKHIRAHHRFTVGGHDLTIHRNILCKEARAYDSQEARHEQFYFFHKHKLWLNIIID